MKFTFFLILTIAITIVCFIGGSHLVLDILTEWLGMDPLIGVSLGWVGGMLCAISGMKFGWNLFYGDD